MSNISISPRGTVSIDQLLRSGDKNEVRLGLKMREADLEHGNNDGKLQKKEAEHLSPRYRKQYEKLLAASKPPVASTRGTEAGRGAQALLLAERSATSTTAERTRKNKPKGAKGLTNLFEFLVLPNPPKSRALFDSTEGKSAALKRIHTMVDSAEIQLDALDTLAAQTIENAYGGKKGRTLSALYTTTILESVNASRAPSEMAGIVDAAWPRAPKVVKAMAASRMRLDAQFRALVDAGTETKAIPVRDKGKTAAPATPKPSRMRSSPPPTNRSNAHAPQTVRTERIVERVVYREPEPVAFADRALDIANAATDEYGLAGFIATAPAGVIGWLFGDQNRPYKPKPRPRAGPNA